MTGTDTTTEPRPGSDEAELAAPGSDRGLAEVFRRRYLLRLLVRKDIKVRYQGSLLGLAWSYIKPGVQFSVYFVVLGIFLGLADKLEDFPVYLFSGLVLFIFFMETFNSTTRSITSNKALIRKVYLPREMFPIASLLVSGFHFLPGLTILLVAALATSYAFTPIVFPAALLGFAIVAAFGLAVGLFFSAFNVFFRDFEKVVDVLNIVVRWSAPMLYPWTLVQERASNWLLQVYLANPLVPAVSLFQRAFWLPGNEQPFELPPHLWTRGLVALAACALLAVVGQWAFSRLERRFAEEL